MEYEYYDGEASTLIRPIDLKQEKLNKIDILFEEFTNKYFSDLLDDEEQSYRHKMVDQLEKDIKALI